MATDDLDNKNTPDKKLDKHGEDELKDKDKVSDKSTDEGNAGIDEGAATTLVAPHMENADAEDSAKKQNLTPEELEEESIDEEETESLSNDCMCMKQDGDYYCFKLKQGRWIQWSVIPYPTKKICEAACCNS
jgi:hypothetical protein